MSPLEGENKSFCSIHCHTFKSTENMTRFLRLFGGESPHLEEICSTCTFHKQSNLSKTLPMEKVLTHLMGHFSEIIYP